MFARKLVPNVAVAPLLVLLAGCGNGNDKNASGGGDSLTDIFGIEDTGPGDSQADETTFTDVGGRWVQGCLAGHTGEAPFTTSRLEIGILDAQLVQSVYSDAPCTERTSETITDFDVTFLFDRTTTQLGDANHINFVAESVTVDGEPDSSAVGDGRYDIFLMINETLYFGDRVNSGDGTTRETRPTELDQIRFYTRPDFLTL